MAALVGTTGRDSLILAFLRFGYVAHPKYETINFALAD
jgi:hypothetical protein